LRLQARERSHSFVVPIATGTTAAGLVGPSEPPLLIEHDPASAEWTSADRAARQRRLTVLELAVDDINRTMQRFVRTRRGRRRQVARDAAREAFESGAGWALVARDPERTAACLFVLTLGRTAVAVLIGVSPARQYRSMSLGKCLFNRTIEGAVTRGCREFSFLTENGYKTAFWHAQGRPTESGFLGRGPIGRAIAAYVTARRVPDGLRHPFAVADIGPDTR
jgi:hypothetical protein